MDKHNKNNTCDKIYSGGVEQYKEKIIDAVNQIDNKTFLNRILISLTEYIKEKKKPE